METSCIAVLIQTAGGRPVPLAHEILGLARRTADSSGGKVGAFLFGHAGRDALDELIAMGADEVYHANDERLNEYHPERYVPYLERLLEQAKASLLLMGHTSTGMDLAPRMAFRVGGAVATGCEALEAKGGALVATRACYGGKAREALSLKALPAVITVRAKTQEALEPDSARTGQIVEFTLESLPEERVRVIQRQREEAKGVRLDNAEVVVAGGRGVGGPEGFQVLGELAQELGGAVGASRVACDLKWVPQSWQIGLTGKTVSPSLYIAAGISGASQHMAGCGRAKAIVAINNDADAEIFKQARFGIVGDCMEVVPALIEEIRRMKQTQAAAATA